MKIDLNNLNKKEKIGLAIAAVFIFLALVDRLIISPINEKMRQFNIAIKSEEKQLSRFLRDLNHKEEVARKVSAYWQFVKKSGSDEEEIARLLGELEQVARSSGVYLADMKPQITKQAELYKEYRVDIEIEGEMPAFMNMLYKINSSPQLLRADKVRLALKDKDSLLIKASVSITKIVVP